VINGDALLSVTHLYSAQWIFMIYYCERYIVHCIPSLCLRQPQQSVSGTLLYRLQPLLSFSLTDNCICLTLTEVAAANAHA